MRYMFARASAAEQESAGVSSALAAQQTSVDELNKITTAFATGAERNITAVNGMFEAIERILGFKVQEAQDVQARLNEFKRWQEEREAEEKQDLRELASVADALIVPLGNAVSAAIEHLATRGEVSQERCLLGFPHPSGANGGRLRDFAARRQELAEKVAMHWRGKAEHAGCSVPGPRGHSAEHVALLPCGPSR